MPPAPLSLTLKQNERFLAQFNWLQPGNLGPVNLSGFTAKMQIRDAPGGALILDFNVAPCTLTVQTAGAILAYAPASSTAALSWTRAYYDLLAVQPNGDPIALCEGPIFLDRGVSV